MCGIAGIFYKDKIISEVELADQLNAMGERLKHRGPDSSGKFLCKTGGLVHTRLSIIDLSHNADQPMRSRGGNVIAYNGEVYNFNDIRLSNYQYKSQCDTEVVLSRIEQDGDNAFNLFNGMYSLAYWNQDEKSLTLARDPMGIKPLYYYEDHEKFVFASEIKSILAIKPLDRSLSIESLNEYFHFGYILDSKSAYSKIKQVSPGSLLKFKDGKVSFENFFSLNSNIKIKDPLSEYESITKLALENRFIADVPVTLFLSGGIDSSTLAYLSGNKDIDLMSLNLEGNDYSELDKAKLVAKTLGRNCLSINQREITFKDIENIVYYADDLISDPALISNYLLYEAASKKYKVGIAGDGADELYLGYHAQLASIFSQGTLFNHLKMFLPITSKIVGSVKPARETKYGFINKLDRFSRYAQYSFPTNHLMWRSPGSFHYLKDANLRLPESFRVMQDGDRLDQLISRLDISTYLAGNILKKVDRMSMAHSMEVRVPFLDINSVQFALSLPSDQKINGLSQKILMKNYLKEVMPKKIFDQPKKGFGPNLHSIFKDKQYKNYLLERDGFFESYINMSLLEKDLNQLDPYNLFTLLFFKVWGTQQKKTF